MKKVAKFIVLCFSMLWIGVFIAIGAFIVLVVPNQMAAYLASSAATSDPNKIMGTGLAFSILMYGLFAFYNYTWSLIEALTERRVGIAVRTFTLLYAAVFGLVSRSSIRIGFADVVLGVSLTCLLALGENVVVSLLNRFFEPEDTEKQKNEHREIDMRRLEDVALSEAQSGYEAVSLPDSARSYSAAAVRSDGFL